MRMSPHGDTLDRLHRVADEVRDTFSARHHNITGAVDSDAAFKRDRRPLSVLVRALVIDGVVVGSSQSGLQCESVAGGGRELLASEGDDIVDHFRLHSAKKVDDQYRIVVNRESDELNEGGFDGQGQFMRDEHWALGYTYDSRGMVVDIFVAKVLGLTDGKVKHLKLGPATALGTVVLRPNDGRFGGTDENELAGFETPNEVGEEDSG